MKTSKKLKKTPGTDKNAPSVPKIAKPDSKDLIIKKRFNEDGEDDFDLQLDDDIKGFDEFDDLDEDDY